MNGPAVEDAMRELGPEHRALVELSVVRGISDEEIGGYLGIDPGRIAERRGAALHALAASCGDGSEQGVLEVVAHLGGDPERAAEDLERAHDTGEIEALTGIEPLDAEPVEGEVEPHDDEPVVYEEPPPLAEVVPAAEEASAAEEEPTRTGEPTRADEPARAEHAPPASGPPGEKRGGRFLAVIFGGLIVAFIVWMAVAVIGGDDPPSLSTTDDPAREAERPTGGTLEPLVPGGRARGRAAITTDGGTARLRLTVRNLPPPQDGGGYVAWLYDSVTDTRSLSGDMRGTFTVNTPLPDGYRRYRYLDVSREPADGNRNHSGQSVLRVPLRSVPGFGG